MGNEQRIIEAFETVIKLMVDRPDEIYIEPMVSETSVVLKLRVAQLDIRKVIGQAGRTARSLRILLAAMGTTHGVRLNLDIQW